MKLFVTERERETIDEIITDSTAINLSTKKQQVLPENISFHGELVDCIHDIPKTLNEPTNKMTKKHCTYHRNLNVILLYNVKVKFMSKPDIVTKHS